MRIRPGLYF